MARLGIYPRFTAFDAAGLPLAQGTVYTYITGTSTPKNSYTSSAGAGSATSFTLDDSGSTVRYFDTDVPYRLVVKDSGGTTLYTINDYVPLSSFTQLDQDLDVNGFSIISNNAGDINITPDSGGDIILNGNAWPSGAGSTNQVIQKASAGQLGWITLSTDLVTDTSPQLGGNLDANGHNIGFDNATGILDDAGNEQLLFAKTASAVNYLQIANAATGNNPTITAAGSDANIGITFVMKGSGVPKIADFTLPITDGTSGQLVKTNGSKVLSIGDPPFATQAEMEAASSTSVFVTPGRVKNHPGVCKGWVMANPSAAISASYNVTSITDNAAGDWTVNWTTSFSSANYAVVQSVGGTTPYTLDIGTLTASTCPVKSYTDTGSNSETNITYWYIAAFGDQ